VTRASGEHVVDDPPVDIWRRLMRNLIRVKEPSVGSPVLTE
jgi:hypothetical protein